VSVIDTATSGVTTIDVGNLPIGVAVSPDGSKVYVTNIDSNTVSVIDTATNGVTSIAVGSRPEGVAVTPNGSKVYVANQISSAVPGTVSVIDTTTNTVIASPSVGVLPEGLAVTPDGSKVYVANFGSNTVSVIATATNTVTGLPIAVGDGPNAFGLFIGPAPRFAGTPGSANCIGKSVSALAHQYGGLARAAAALGYSSVQALQNAIQTFCAG